jgi:cytochrome c peroxidase
VLAANAIAAFEARAFRADESGFDRYLRGEQSLAEDAERGMRLFYGRAGCADCHAGKFQTDHDFHAIAMPQVGPGKGDGSDGSYWRASGLQAFLEDQGRGRVTARDTDRYAFRTPSLRNVTATGPWGHDGAYRTLESVVRHHLDPVAALERYVPPVDLLPALDAVLELTATGSRLEPAPLTGPRLAGFLRRDTWVQENAVLRSKLAAANELAPRALSDANVADLLAFLASLTDTRSLELSTLVPDRVPSGLPVADASEEGARERGPVASRSVD